MTFPKPPNATPVSVGIIEITLLDYPAASEPFPAPARKEINYRFQLLNQAGEVVRTPNGNLEQYLTPQQLTALKNFMDTVRVKSVEALP